MAPSLTEIDERILDFIGQLVDAYRFLDIPIRQYLIQYIGSSLVMAAIAIGAGLTIASSGVLRYGLYALGLFAPLVVVIYPLIRRESKKREIDENFHLFITHVTVLSLTNTDRIDIFREIANEEEYGALATEMGRLVAYIDTFNMSLDDACRRRANETGSDLLSNFYEKLAYSVGSGQSISAFLYSEQEDVRKMYATEYESRLQKLETVGELFLSTALASAFLFVFAMLMPFLTGMQPIVVLGGAVFLYSVVQVVFIMLINSVAPHDDLWYFPDDRQSRKHLWIRGALAVGLAGSAVAVFLTVLFAAKIPVHFYPIMVVTPLGIPAVVFYRMERGIRNSEDQYPSFIRGVGSIESVKQTSTEDVLETLKEKDFGALSQNIVQLYRRLYLSINTRKSWNHFSVEVGSNLIKRFTDMYVLGREMGGDPEKLGDIVSENFRQVHQLREKRKTMKRKLAGILYGITAATSFTFFAAFEILKIMVDLGDKVSGDFASTILYASVYNLPVLQAMLFATVIFNSLAVAIIVRRVGRMHIGGATIHLTLLIWINFLTGYAVSYAASQFSVL